MQKFQDFIRFQQQVHDPTDNNKQKGVAQYKVPDQMILLDEFPHTATGKINKRMLLTMANK